MYKILAAVALVTTAVAAADSPLVALAKRTNRAGSKSPVITNETLAKTRGTFSTAGGESAAAEPPKASAKSASTIARQPAVKVEGASAPAPDPAAAKTAPAAASAVLTPRSAPAMSSVGMSVYPQTTVRNIEPQSTARTVTPASTAGTINPTSTASTSTPATSAQNIQPQSTARTIEPQAVQPRPPE